MGGVCVGGTAVTCVAIDACHVTGTCDPSSGACSNPVAADGTPCPGGTCLQGTCQASEDAGSGDGGTTDGGTDGAAGSDAAVTDAGPDAEDAAALADAGADGADAQSPLPDAANDAEDDGALPAMDGSLDAPGNEPEDAADTTDGAAKSEPSRSSGCSCDVLGAERAASAGSGFLPLLLAAAAYLRRRSGTRTTRLSD
jgi:hypothetical protein